MYGVKNQIEIEKVKDFGKYEINSHNIYKTTNSMSITNLIDLKEFIEYVKDFLHRVYMEFSEEYEQEGYEIIPFLSEFSIHFYVKRPIRGGTFMKSPTSLVKGNSIMTPQNKDDDQCFKWVFYIKEYEKVKNISRDLKKFEQKKPISLNFNDIQFPVEFNCNVFEQFEKQNPSFPINVYEYDEYDDERLEIEYRSMYGANQMNVTNIMYIHPYGEYSMRSFGHYVYIKSVSRLLSRYVTKEKISCLFCLNCFQHFRVKDEENRKNEQKKKKQKNEEKTKNGLEKAKEKWKSHIKSCSKMIFIPSEVLPQRDEKGRIPQIKYGVSDLKYSQRQRFIGYMDLETIQLSIEKQLSDNTKILKRQLVSQCGAYLVTRDDYPEDRLLGWEKPIILTKTSQSEEDPVVQFFKKLKEDLPLFFERLYQQRF